MLRLAPGHKVIDATINGGGHAHSLLREIGPTGTLLGLDRDPTVLERLRTEAALDVADSRLRLVAANFVDIAQVAGSEGFTEVDAIVFDLGLSTHHLEASGRGFSFDRDERLDLRFDTTDPQLRPAAQLLKRVSADTLERIIFTYGEERHAHRIARHIVQVRTRRPIETSRALRDCVLEALPPPAQRHSSRSLARVFQALRIETNRELEALEGALPQVPTLLRPGGRVAIIAFHSLEDRIVKRFFRQASAAGELRSLTKKPVRPGSTEIGENPRARSARLRVAERPANGDSPPASDGRRDPRDRI